MRHLTSIVARANAGAIGAANRLPWHVKSDLRFFRDSTIDQVVIMGRRTHDSLGGCLPRRQNVVVTHGFALFPEDRECQSAGSIEEALWLAAKLAGAKRNAFVVGGATMYEQFSQYVDRYLVTEIHKAVADADTFFDESLFRDSDRWCKRLVKEGEANDAGDEASFQIFEYVARDSDQIAQRRQQAINQLKARSGSPFDTASHSAASLWA